MCMQSISKIEAGTFSKNAVTDFFRYITAIFCIF